MSSEPVALSWARRLQEERRLHIRASQPWLRVETEGFAYIVHDWSVGGAAINHFHSNGSVGSLVTGNVGLSGTETLSPFQADIVRQDAHGRTALRWLNMDAALQHELDQIARHR
ncbi:MAG: hypothetical protein HEP70_10490 [Rhodobiaceae bacterium]|nr:hypothetical protein [Rhodobiaceae bacterium]